MELITVLMEIAIHILEYLPPARQLLQLQTLISHKNVGK